MSYADQSAMSPRKIVAIVLVGLLHALLGYAFITGLAYNVIKKTIADTKVFDVAEEPPPPEEKPPPPPPETKVEPPPLVSPPPIVSMPTMQAPQIQVVPRAPPPVITPTAPVAPPPPPRPSQASAAQPRGDISTWVTTEDYPSRALREEREGVTAVAWDVDATGKVVNCRVTQSSGSPDLDDASCKNITRRGRYKPALDAAGQPMASTSGFSRRVRWQIPKD